MSNPRNFELLLNHEGAQHRIRFEFDLSLTSHQNIYGCVAYNRLYEAGTSAVLIHSLRPGDVFIDVGAHIGYFTLLASRMVGSNGRVISLEPEQRNYLALLNHLKINDIGNVLPLPWAASSKRGVVDLYTDPENDGGHAIWNVARRMKDEMRSKVTRQPTFAITLDELARSLSPGNIKAIKIDVEGFEMEVLKGMQTLLSSGQLPILILEINRSVMAHMDVTERDIRQLMGKQGYSVFIDEPDSGRLLPLAAEQEHETNFVFNLVFFHPRFAVPEGLRLP